MTKMIVAEIAVWIGWLVILAYAYWPRRSKLEGK